MSQKDVDNESFARTAQEWLGVPVDGHAGVLTLAAFLAKTGHNGVRVVTSGKHVSPKGIALIHSFESCKLTAYADPGSADGRPHTIGWGSTGPDIRLGMTWTQKQADERFAADLGSFEKAVSNLAPKTTQNQFDALVSFAYNVGTQALRTSTLLRMHNAGDYAGAKAQFARWNKNDGKVMPGLTRRRAAEAQLYGEP